MKSRWKVGAEAGDFGDGEGFVDRGGDFALVAAREGEGEQAALEFGFGLGGESGEGCADVGQHDGLAEEGHGLSVRAAGDEQGLAAGFARHVGIDACRG